MGSIATELDISGLIGAYRESVYAVPLTLASRAVKTNHIATFVGPSIVNHLFFSLSEDDRHKATIRAEIDSCIFVLRTWDVLDGLVDEVPES